MIKIHEYGNVDQDGQIMHSKEQKSVLSFSAIKGENKIWNTIFNSLHDMLEWQSCVTHDFMNKKMTLDGFSINVSMYCF